MAKVVIASDHGGFALKADLAPKLKAAGHEVLDLGPENAVSCDYPQYAEKLVREVLDSGALGILICGTGLGMSMAANRHGGIRAAVCTDEYMASMARKHNNANVLCMGERVIGPGLGQSIAETFLNTGFEGERHLRRINMFDKPGVNC